MPDHSTESIFLSGVLQKILPSIVDTAGFIAAERQVFHSGKIEYKSFNNLVSYVDREAEKMLCDACSVIISDSGFIREEGDNVDTDSEYRWIIDPLDGTTNFIHGIPAFCISVALQKKKETVLGIIYDINRQEAFTTIKGNGAFLNGEKMAVSPEQEIGRSLLGTGFPYHQVPGQDDYLSALKQFLQKCHGIRRIGSAALDLAWVACGRLEGFYEIGLNAWDVAAGCLLVTEAGGRVSDFSGTDNYLFGKQIVASNDYIHEDLVSVTKSLGTKG